MKIILLAVDDLVLEMQIAVPLIEGLMRRVALEVSLEVLGSTDCRHSVFRSDKSLFEVCLSVKIHGIDKHQILAVGRVQKQDIRWEFLILVQLNDVANFELSPSLVHRLLLPARGTEHLRNARVKLFVGFVTLDVLL